jgi:hypothetical protein
MASCAEGQVLLGKQNSIPGANAEAVLLMTQIYNNSVL